MRITLLLQVLSNFVHVKISCRFVTFASCMSLQTVKFVYGMEFLSGRWRVTAATLFNMPQVIGYVIFPLIVKLLMDSFWVC